MKVLCVEKSSDKCWNSGKKVPVPIVGEVYTVTDSVIERRGELFYELESFPPRIYYESILFIPLSDISETNFQREYKKELV